MTNKETFTSPARPQFVIEKATGRKWRMNGKCQTWKTRPAEFRQPVKFGLYSYGAITHENAHQFTAD